MKRVLLTVAMMLLVGPLLVLPALEAEAAPAAATNVGPQDTIPGEWFAVTAKLGPAVTRPVRLQRWTARGWVTEASNRTSATGFARLLWRTTQLRTTLRISAPAVRIAGITYGARASAPRLVVQRAQVLRLRAAHTGIDKASVTVTTSHVRRGRQVLLQTRVGSAKWKRVAALEMGRTTTRTFKGISVRNWKPGQQVQARLVAHKSAPAVNSNRWKAPSVQVSTRWNGAKTVITAKTGGKIDLVRFFVDGVAVGEDKSAPYTRSIRLRAGRHDVMARAIGPLGSHLSGASDVVSDHETTDETGMAPGFSLEAVQSGFDLPTTAAVANPQLVFVAEKAGVVKAITLDEAGDWGQPKTVLDISSSVINEADAGMVGMVADPEFAENGYVYVSYVLDEGETGQGQAQQVARFTWDGTRLVHESRHVVLGRVTGPDCYDAENLETPDCVPLFGRAHTIGDLAFDPEGNLLVGVGDGSIYITEGGLGARREAMRSQNPEILAGKVLRIDPVTGRGVPDNPMFTGDGSSNSARVLALGFRNPFRFVVEGDSDHLIVGDVGEARFEELNRVHLDPSAGSPENFGWPCREGVEDTDLGDISAAEHPFHSCLVLRDGDLTGPIHTYRHTAGGGSVTAGVFMEGAGYPAWIRGQFLYGDYAQNHLRSLTLDHDEEPSGLRTLANSSAAMGPVKIFTGPDGWAWSVSIYDGSLRRLTYGDEGHTDRCQVGQFRQSFHDLDGANSAFDKEYPDNEWRWLYPYQEVQLPPEHLGSVTCVAAPELPATAGSPWLTADEQDTRAHPGDRFGAAWRGRVQLEAGTYRFTVRGSEWMRLRVDDEPVHDFYSNDFWGDLRTHDVELSTGQHSIAVEYIHGDERDAYARVAWERIGGPPSVRLSAPANGSITSGSLPWRVKVSDPDGDTVADLLAKTRVTADFLHFDGEKFHSHPYAQSDGVAAGTFEVDDAHAPRHGVIRLRATTADASGARASSAPVYVCFDKGQVGPCRR